MVVQHAKLDVEVLVRICMLNANEGQSGVKSEVEAALGIGMVPSVPEVPEVVALQGVKTEEAPVIQAEPVKQVESQPAPVTPVEPAKPVKVDELKAQIDNLNIAIKKEREEGKVKSEALAKKLEDSNAMFERLKMAVNPVAEVPETPAEISPTHYLTPEQAEAIWERKEAERQSAVEDEKRTNAIQNEIKTLESQWNGKEGKPLYDDTKVLEWQKNNERLYLSPTEAFQAMASKEIIDWEVKQRLSGKIPVEKVESPSTIPGQHEPKMTLPKTEAETRAAILEALNNADSEI